ncbi:MAG: hypothetical protein CMJ39_11715 [Phycisphaerae bacterium]|nr:hypothetical protein [Phycisphaerae bacterium]
MPSLCKALLCTMILGSMTLSTGCGTATRSSSTHDTVRFASFNANSNPLAMGAGDTLGASLFMAQERY